MSLFESRAELHERMQKWCAKFGTDARVLEWLAHNPPPDIWKGTESEWAFFEMPLAPGWWWR